MTDFAKKPLPSSHVFRDPLITLLGQEGHENFGVNMKEALANHFTVYVLKTFVKFVNKVKILKE